MTDAELDNVFSLMHHLKKKGAIDGNIILNLKVMNQYFSGQKAGGSSNVPSGWVIDSPSIGPLGT